MKIRIRGLKRTVWLFPAFVLVLAQLAYGDQYHYTNIIVGERPAGLGGAYTAISDDPSGLYYNPAGAAYDSGSSLSASVNAHYSTTKEYNKVLGGNGWERKSSSLLPNFFGVTQPLGAGKIGFSYAVSDSLIEDQNQTFYNLPSTAPSLTDPTQNALISQYVINFNNQDNTINFGPSYSIAVSKAVSLGTTVYVHYRKNEWILNQLIRLDDGRYEWSNEYFETTEWGLRPILGVMVSPESAKYSIGLVASRTFLIDSNTHYQSTYKGINYSGNTLDRTDIKSTEKRKYPYTFTLGVAYFPSNSLLFDWDVSYYTKFDDNVLGERRAVVNTALGSEYYFTPSVALRAGVYTNFANTPEPEYGKTNQPEHVNLYGGSMSLSYFTKGTSLTAGTSYSYGKGKAQVMSDPQGKYIQDVTASTLMVFIGASYSY